MTTTDNLTLTEYQKIAESTAIYPGSGEKDDVAINYTIIGMGNEAGEVLGKWKKFLRGDDGVELSAARRAAILDEVGDVLWYAANLCSELDASLADVAFKNAAKLGKRAEAGTLHGDGDNR